MSNYQRTLSQLVEGTNLSGLIGFEGALRVKQIGDEALMESARYARENNLMDGRGNLILTDNEADAFRHSYLTIKLAKEFGPDTAKEITSMHEHLSGSDPSQAGARHMDFHNNKVGLDLAFDKNFINHTPRQMAEIAVEKGILITDPTHMVPDAVWEQQQELREQSTQQEDKQEEASSPESTEQNTQGMEQGTAAHASNDQTEIDQDNFGEAFPSDEVTQVSAAPDVPSESIDESFGGEELGGDMGGDMGGGMDMGGDFGGGFGNDF